VGVEVPLPTSPPGDPVAQALDFLERYRDLYRLQSPRTRLYLTRVFTDATGAHVFFGQHQDGVPVYPAEIGVHLSDGVVWYTSGRHLPRLPELAPPRVDPGAARMIAAAAVPGTNVEPIGDVRLMYFNQGLLSGHSTDTHLAWRVYLRGSAAADGAGTTWMYFIDARDGGVLLGVDESLRAFRLSVRNADHEAPDACFGDDVEEWFSEAGPTADYPGQYPGGDADADAAYLAAGRAYDFYLALGRDSYDGEGRERIQAFVHYNDPGFGNAAWDPACQVFYFGDETPSDFSFGHELTHAVISFSSMLGASADPRALGESYGDVFGSLLSDSFEAIRNPTNRGYFDHMDDYDPSDEYGNSGIPSKAAHLIIEGGTHRGFFIRALDPEREREQARWLFYDTMLGLESSADLAAAADATIARAEAYVREELWGFTDADVCWVRNAFAAVGLAVSIDRDCDEIRDADDPDVDGDGVAVTGDQRVRAVRTSRATTTVRCCRTRTSRTPIATPTATRVTMTTMMMGFRTTIPNGFAAGPAIRRSATTTAGRSPIPIKRTAMETPSATCARTMIAMGGSMRATTARTSAIQSRRTAIWTSTAARPATRRTIARGPPGFSTTATAPAWWATIPAGTATRSTATTTAAPSTTRTSPMRMATASATPATIAPTSRTRRCAGRRGARSAAPTSAPASPVPPTASSSRSIPMATTSVTSATRTATTTAPRTRRICAGASSIRLRTFSSTSTGMESGPSATATSSSSSPATGWPAGPGPSAFRARTSRYAFRSSPAPTSAARTGCRRNSRRAWT
jgi:hypothetical protein